MEVGAKAFYDNNHSSQYVVQVLGREAFYQRWLRAEE